MENLHKFSLFYSAVIVDGICRSFTFKIKHNNDFRLVGNCGNSIWLLVAPQTETDLTSWQPVLGLLMAFCWHFLLISRHFQLFSKNKFFGYSGSLEENNFSQKPDSDYTYWCLVYIFRSSQTVSEFVTMKILPVIPSFAVWLLGGAADQYSFHLSSPL